MLRAFRFGVVVLGLFVVAMLSAVMTMHFAIHGAEVTVPDYRGLTTAEAARRSASLGLTQSVDSRFYSADMPAGRVLSQSPAVGTVVRREWHLRLTESLGPQKAAIPNVIGKEERVATIEVRRAGLDIGSVAHLPFAGSPENTVIAQTPAPDAAGVERPVVSLLVAAAPDVVASGGMVMPDFTGQPYAAAAAAVTKAGLKLAPAKDMAVSIPAVPDVASTKPMAAPIPAGAVVSQSPPAGYRIDLGAQVEFTVAK
ncbi:PASTA domain-containing protein [Acidipila rosea]|uniref:Beta-lactam-binding protein with PASTA domain n=1 Tax=Acidipila rosea TaxID=768535 RepID=A0A4R1LF17_9BACT|nr:PASTA domain-containing protein [Acidipila rosea]TCK75249.1 beta-lactam-binding protein with PASTA domain [Acidipila rosea]